MARVNPLAIKFLDRHPSDCARILEQLEVNEVCNIIQTVEPDIAAPVLECMMTSYGADCLRTLDVSAAVSLVREMKMPQAARLLRAMDEKLSKKILQGLSVHIQKSLRDSLRYPEHTVGRVMDSNPFCLPENISVSEAVKRIKNVRQQIVHEIFIVDDNYIFIGAVRVTDLLAATKASSLSAVMIRDIPVLDISTHISSAAQNTGWQTFDTLPVVGKDHTLSGTLKSSVLLHVLAQSVSEDVPDALSDLFSMTKMFWIVMADLLGTAAVGIKERGVDRN